MNLHPPTARRWWATGCALALAGLARAATPAIDSTVAHDVHQPYPLASPAANDVRAVTLDPRGRVWAATRAGVFSLTPPNPGWIPVATPQTKPGPAFALAADPRGPVWIGAWNGLFRIDDGPPQPTPGIKSPINALAIFETQVLAGGPEGFFLVRSNVAEKLDLPCPTYVNRIVPAPDGTVWIATRMGLHQWRDGRLTPLDFDPDAVSADVRGLALHPRGQIWAAALGGLQVFQAGRLVRQVTTADGLPSADLRCVARDDLDQLWVGTASGLGRWDDRRWTVRRSQRWLLDDDVRDIAFGPDAAWIATAGGVSQLRRETLTLEAKARRFQDTLEARHVRPPGLVGQCRLLQPGALESWQPTDDDNEGGYTAVYLAMESFQYAVTRNPQALARARDAFAALEFLVDVTGTNRCLARTVVPADWSDVHDPNTPSSPPDWAEEQVQDPRAKRVRIRWHPSDDGRWLWKGDTSSDELTAHMFGYFVFHDLAAPPPDRDRVRYQVCRLIDRLIDNGFVLRDPDGLPTRWGVWAPDRLNRDPNWAMERGINSVQLLSFLRLAHHVSQDAKYLIRYRQLIADHRFDQNVRQAPNLNPAWRTHIDFELLAFAYPALIRLEPERRLRNLYRQSLERWHNAIRDDRNPFFEFVYAYLADPKNARIDDALASLRDTPLDLVSWDSDNRAREDLQLRRAPELEDWQTDRWLPPSEISYTRTDQNPWLAVQGDGGLAESDGVFWLLPYWMGRYHGWVPSPR